MDLITKDLLINFLIYLTFSMFSANNLYVQILISLKGLNNRMIAILPVISIILCMLFPVYVDENFVFGTFVGFRLF